MHTPDDELTLAAASRICGQSKALVQCALHDFWAQHGEPSRSLETALRMRLADATREALRAHFGQAIGDVLEEEPSSLTGVVWETHGRVTGCALQETQVMPRVSLLIVEFRQNDYEITAEVKGSGCYGKLARPFTGDLPAAKAACIALAERVLRGLDDEG